LGSGQDKYTKPNNRRSRPVLIGLHPMLETESRPAASSSATVLSSCPECHAPLAVLRVIGGRAGCEYWTMRCTGCGGIHLDIVQPASLPHIA